jgi:sugar phosphate isomerase/epimerase
VNVGLEACTRAYARTAEQVLGLARSSGAARVGVYYDPGNSVIAGLDPAAEIPLLGERLKGLHVKDPGGGRLGEGKVDFDAVTAAVKENGYSGALILETPAGDDPRGNARFNLEFTRKRFDG